MKSKTIRSNKDIYKLKSANFDSLKIIPFVSKCKRCGKKFYNPKSSPPSDEQKNIIEYISNTGVCYECAYWLLFIKSPPDYLQISNGVCYNIFPFIEEPTITMTLGGKGKTQYFITSNKTLIKSNDVWKIGTIPERFKHLLPDTGWFCSKKVYQRFQTFDKLCNEAGCLDRYKCFRFKTEIEIENGPFNTVPKNWVDGDEHCKFFINTDELMNYNSPLTKK